MQDIGVSDGGATILHADLDAFYASVVLLDRPGLVGRPVAVGGGVVLSCTYEARRYGVEGGMPVREARERCPQLVVVDGDFASFVEYSDRVFDVFRDFTPVVEPISIDEAFLDVSGATGLFGPPESIGRQLRAAVRAATGLPVSVGASRTKFVAKIASRVAKPDGLVVVPPGEELAFLHPLPVGHLWGVGPVTLERLAGFGIRTVGDLASTDRGALRRWIGNGTAAHLNALAWNRDPRGVVPRARARSVGSQSSFAIGERSPDVHRRVLRRLADRVGARLRKKGIAGRTITVRVRFAGFESVTRAHSMRTATAATSVLARAAEALVDGVRTEYPDRGIGLLAISVSKLQRSSPLQLELPMFTGDLLGGSPRELELQALDASIDDLRGRFGREVVTQASTLIDRRATFADGLSDIMTRDR